MNNEWKSVIISAEYVESYSAKCNRIDISGGTSMNLHIWLYIPAKLCRYNGRGQCKISYLPHFDYAEKLEAFVADLENSKYEIEIDETMKNAINEAVDGAHPEYDYCEWEAETDRLYAECKDGREQAADVRKYDAEFLAGLNVETTNEGVEATEKCVWRPAVDPDKEEIVKHVPAPLAPVEIEADPELVR